MITNTDVYYRADLSGYIDGLEYALDIAKTTAPEDIVRTLRSELETSLRVYTKYYGERL